MRSKKLSSVAFVLIVVLTWSCSSSNSPNPVNTNNNNNNNNTNSGSGNTNAWLIPQNQVLDGGPGKDGIPALENPEMISASEATYLDDFDLVIGYKKGDDVRAYPHKILDWHEIINDQVDGEHVAITYCPLTDTGIGWGVSLENQITTFGVSGLLYNTNLMPYDRKTNSTWSQLLLKCVHGPLIGTDAETFEIFETEWGTWKRLYPDTKVVSLNTGYSRNYQRYPYGDYRTQDGLLFGVSVNDTRLDQKERVHGIISGDRVKVYRFSSFVNNPIILDNFGGTNYVLVGSQEENYIVSFEQKEISGEVLEFTMVDPQSPAGQLPGALIQDQLGNTWDVFGHAIDGPNTGETMKIAKSMKSYWFAWAPFYADPEIFE